MDFRLLMERSALSFAASFGHSGCEPKCLAMGKIYCHFATICHPQTWHVTGDEHQFGLHVEGAPVLMGGCCSVGVVGGVNSVGRTENGSS